MVLIVAKSDSLPGMVKPGLRRVLTSTGKEALMNLAVQ